jgi:CubicO group peptidase (beta-lactamase class C family)
MTSRSFSQSRLDRMHNVMNGYVERGDIPGIVTLVARHDEVHVDAVGTFAHGGNEPMQRDTIFRIASMTKPIAAVAALILIEECRLRLDDPVDEFLPELANRQVLSGLDSEVGDTVPANRALTLRDLLTFTSGYGIVMAMPATYPIQRAMTAAGIVDGPPHPQEVPAPDAWLSRLAAFPLLTQPGERWHYNTASDIIGILIARASGRTRFRANVWKLPAGENLRAARHGGHRFQRFPGEDRPTCHEL